MKLTKQKRGTAISMNITPMIDIVFLLIIFFITVSQLSEARDEPVELPQITGAEEQKPSSITVNINESGEVVVNKTKYNVPELMNLVADELAAKDNQPSLLKVVIRQDRRGTCETINQVMTQLKDFGINQVRIGVREP